MNKNIEKYNMNDSYPLLMATCSKLLRESLNNRFTKDGFKITSEQWIILVHLWYQDGLSQQTIADRYERSKVAAFRLIGRLEEQGFVVRQSDPVDGRCKRIFLTSKGRKVIQSLIPLANKNKDQAISGISDGDLNIFKRVLKKIIKNINN